MAGDGDGAKGVREGDDVLVAGSDAKKELVPTPGSPKGLEAVREVGNDGEKEGAEGKVCEAGKVDELTFRGKATPVL